MKCCPPMWYVEFRSGSCFDIIWAEKFCFVLRREKSWTGTFQIANQVAVRLQNTVCACQFMAQTGLAAAEPAGWGKRAWCSVGCIQNMASSFGLPNMSMSKTSLNWSELAWPSTSMAGSWSVCLRRGLFGPKKSRDEGMDLLAACPYLKGGDRGDGAWLLTVMHGRRNKPQQPK